MLASMTGFGQASASIGEVFYSLEIKSLNGKFFKSAIRLPETLSTYEPRIEQVLRERLVRGSITYTLRVKDVSDRAAWDVNSAAIRGYIRSLEQAGKHIGPQTPVRIDLTGMLALPGVCQMREPDPAEQERRRQSIEELTCRAIERVIAMRHEEGKALGADLEDHSARIRESIVHIRERAPIVVKEYAERLRKRVQTLLMEVKVELTEDDLAREIAILAERADINEELARLDSHLDQFRSVMAEEHNAGRKLEFLAQEMLRETNTIGSKANDSLIARYVVDLKGHIDRIREQVMNVV